MDFLACISEQVCASVGTAQLYAAAAWQLTAMKALHDTSGSTSSSLNLDDRLQALLKRLARVLGAQRAMVGLMDAPDATRCRLCVGYDGSKADPWLRHLDLSPDRYPEIQEVARTRRPLVIPDVFAEPLLGPVREHLEPVGLRSLIVLPLLVREHAIGAISLGYVGRGRTLTDHELRFCQSMADLSAAAIANAQLFEQVARAKVEWEITFDSIPELVAIIDAEHCLVRVNRALAARLGTSPDCLVGQRCYAALHGTDAPWPGCPHPQALATGRPTTLEIEDPHLGGIFLITTSPLLTAEDQPLGCVHIARDITEMKRLEEEARERQRFEDLSRAKSAFIATMSHELRTPLNSILGFSELMLGQAVGPLTDKQSRYLGHIHEGGKHLLDLINDILDVSRVEAGKIELACQPVLLDQAIEASLALARPHAEKAGVMLVSEIPSGLPPVLAEPVRLKQCLFNLVSNAIKFTPSGGLVTVTARRVSGEPETRGHREPETGGTGDPTAPAPRCADSPIRDERGFLEISVRDTGIGIKAEDIPKLFTEFGQLEAGKAAEKRGTGLGLALTGKLVELHGGQIWVESEGEGRGSTFAFTLPFTGSAGVRRET
jgi:PAS domain S-box-containing protein